MTKKKKREPLLTVEGTAGPIMAWLMLLLLLLLLLLLSVMFVFCCCCCCCCCVFCLVEMNSKTKPNPNMWSDCDRGRVLHYYRFLVVGQKYGVLFLRGELIMVLHEWAITARDPLLITHPHIVTMCRTKLKSRRPTAREKTMHQQEVL